MEHVGSRFIKLTKALVIEQISGAQSRADELLFSLAAEVQAVHWVLGLGRGCPFVERGEI